MAKARDFDSRIASSNLATPAISAHGVMANTAVSKTVNQSSNLCERANYFGVVMVSTGELNNKFCGMGDMLKHNLNINANENYAIAA